MRKLRWWWQSIQGLRAHLALFRVIHRAVKAAHPEDKGAALEALRKQEQMVGHCLLHVLLVYPVGSGRFWPDDDE